MFTNFCAGAEQDTLQQDAPTAVQTEADTGWRTTKKCDPPREKSE